jgi:hypothetical protein
MRRSDAPLSSKIRGGNECREIKGYGYPARWNKKDQGKSLVCCGTGQPVEPVYASSSPPDCESKSPVVKYSSSTG